MSWHHDSVYEMDKHIKELEQAMTLNDKYLQRLEALNAELLEALKYTRLFIGQPTPVSAKIDAIIAQAQAFKL